MASWSDPPKDRTPARQRRTRLAAGESPQAVMGDLTLVIERLEKDLAAARGAYDVADARASIAEAKAAKREEELATVRRELASLKRRQAMVPKKTVEALARHGVRLQQQEGDN